MRATSALLLTAAMALGVTSVAMADDRGPSDDQPRASRNHDDRGDHPVWSRERPRPHFYANRRPPAMRHEFRPHCPGPSYVWISGYWAWDNMFCDWIWVDGFWGMPPRPGVVYVAPSYAYDGGRVEYVEGGWCDSTYANDDGAATGVVLGGVAGGIIGHQSHKTGLGVVLGALVGGLIGHDVDRQRAEERAAKREAAKAQAAAQAEQDRKQSIETGQQTSDAELAAAQERARVAKEKLAAAKAEEASALKKAEALKKANAEADAAEAELQAMQK